MGGTVLLWLGMIGAASAAPPNWNENWPQWRGPLATGVAPLADPPLNWSETENVKWKVKLPGSGSSTPIVWGDRIFLQTAIATGKKGQPAAPQAEPSSHPAVAPPPDEIYQFVLLCLDRETGRTLWQRVAREEVPHESHHLDHGFASYSPITDGEHVIAYFGSRGIYAFDMDGKLLWEKDLGNMQTRSSFGEGSSPALSGNTVVVNWDHEGDDDFIVAFDKRNGRELWRQPREEPTSWATPLVVEHQGKSYVVTGGTERVRTYDLQTGELVWHAEGLTLNVIPSPVAADGVVYLMSGFRGNALQAIRLGQSGDLSQSEAILWSHDRHTPYVPSPLLYGRRLYFLSSNNAILSCFDVKTGQALFGPKRLQNLQGVYASPVGAAERVYLIGRNGAALVLENADELNVLAENELDEPIDASPALVGKSIFLRGKEHLYCIEKP